MNKNRPATLGELKDSGWQSRSIKDELRQNLMQRIKNNEPLFKTIVGFEETVLPQIENAILSKHNFILLGLRGQAKSRIIRELYHLLDDGIPAIKGTQLNEDPYNPISPLGTKLIAENGNKTEIVWLSRRQRFCEKLATPDVSIADLIGDIDPIKAAREKLDISNEEVIHWGIIPRTNRGIFAINELPDLQPRIQVGLLNILEENEIQVRGFPLRVPLDILLVFTANPEDYTNRGNIITPLKDRIDSQIVTHYPRSLAEARLITEAESDHETKKSVEVPGFLRDIIEEVSIQARQSEYVDQTSGVSARVAISAFENFLSNVERRSLRNGGGETFPRMCDVYSTIPSISGKIELVYEGEQEGSVLVARNLIGLAINSIFLSLFPQPVKGKQDPDQPPEENPYEAVMDYFSTGRRLEISDKMSGKEYREALDSVAGLKELVEEFSDGSDEQVRYLKMEFVLEGLHHNNMIAREDVDSAVRYRDVFSDMLKGMGDNN